MAKPKTEAAKELEAYEQSVIDAAAIWTAFQRRGPFDRQKFESTDRDEVRSAGRLMLADSPRHNVLIYAVNGEGRSVLAETMRSESQ